jgi:ubiquinone/menaquinone biosynthesis C-methylase UbiE
MTVRRRGSYGIDAPYVPLFLGVALILQFVLAVRSGRWQTFVPLAFVGAILGCFLHTTRRGKFMVWSDLLDRLGLRGNERILDMGCGRGAVLLMAAQRLATGTATGVDLWRRADQSGNSIDATRRNALVEGVADRVRLCTGDMTALPLDDKAFDVVVSSLAIHNISGRARRDAAITEAVRVLRPGGRLVIADIRSTQAYEALLVRLGMRDVARRRLGWMFWWGGPWAATCVVTASKALSSEAVADRRTQTDR